MNGYCRSNSMESSLLPTSHVPFGLPLVALHARYLQKQGAGQSWAWADHAEVLEYAHLSEHVVLHSLQATRHLMDYWRGLDTCTDDLCRTPAQNAESTTNMAAPAATRADAVQKMFRTSLNQHVVLKVERVNYPPTLGTRLAAFSMG